MCVERKREREFQTKPNSLDLEPKLSPNYDTLKPQKPEPRSLNPSPARAQPEPDKCRPDPLLHLALLYIMQKLFIILVELETKMLVRNSRRAG